jgi:NADH-quinone oxidoreductase subunit G
MDGEPHLKGTARPDVARVSPAAAFALGVRDGDPVAVRGPASSITLPVAVTAMLDDVVWLPAHIDGISTAGRLGAVVGDRVHIDPITAGSGATGFTAGGDE